MKPALRERKRLASEGQPYKSGLRGDGEDAEGLPEPLTILRGAAMTTAPVGGN